MTTELRCIGRQLYGYASDDAKGTLEVRCRRRECGYRPGVIILHTLSLETGETTKTLRFSEPRPQKGT